MYQENGKIISQGKIVAKYESSKNDTLYGVRFNPLYAAEDPTFMKDGEPIVLNLRMIDTPDGSYLLDIDRGFSYTFDDKYSTILRL